VLRSIQRWSGSRRGTVLAVLLGVLLGVAAQSALPGHPAGDAARTGTPVRAALLAHGANSHDGGWVGSWATVPTTTPVINTTTFANQTIREIVHVSVGGDAVRVRLTNEFGSTPLQIGEARVARRAAAGGAQIAAGTDRRLTFNGRGSVTIPPGAPLISDPVPLSVPARSDLVVSLFLPVTTLGKTIHAFSFQTNYAAAGNVTGRANITPTATFTAWYFLSEVSVHSGRNDGAVVTFGDSITDGANTVADTNHRWPDFLAQRLLASHREVGVLNEGISGNRMLHDPNPPPGDGEGFAAFFGESALRRFDRDVASHTDARYVVVLLGINDIGQPGTVSAPASETVTAADIIGAHHQLVVRAHLLGLRIYGATLMPFANDTLGFFSPAREVMRQTVNAWIRTSHEYDGVIDFDRAMRDPRHPDQLNPAFDSGDHLHPNDVGTQAMANAVPLGLFG
jgi:lysophospholipase L1-like esterase